MKRVVLLVCLIVSVVELDWERQRIYLLSSVASLLLVLYGELMPRRKVQRVATEGVLKSRHDVVTSEVYVSDSAPPDYRPGLIENGLSRTAIRANLSTTPMPAPATSGVLDSEFCSRKVELFGSKAETTR